MYYLNATFLSTIPHSWILAIREIQKNQKDNLAFFFLIFLNFGNLWKENWWKGSVFFLIFLFFLFFFDFFEFWPARKFKKIKEIKKKQTLSTSFLSRNGQNSKKKKWPFFFWFFWFFWISGLAKIQKKTNRPFPPVFFSGMAKIKKSQANQEKQAKIFLFFLLISGMARIQKNKTSKKWPLLVLVFVTIWCWSLAISFWSLLHCCCHLVAFVAIVMPVLIFGCGLDPVLLGYLVLVLWP